MIEGVWLALRAAAVLLVVQTAGALFFAAVSLGALRASAWRDGRRAGPVALAVLLVQALFEPVHLAGDLSGLLEPSLLQLFVSGSTALALGVRIAAVTVLVFLARDAPQPLARGLALTASLVALSSFALTGHTAVAPQRALLTALLIAHLSIVAYWFGSLRPLLRLARGAPANAVGALRAFSAVAGVVVPVIAVAGIAMALLLADAAAWRGGYGLALLTKLALFLVLMVLAALNRLRFTPAMARGDVDAAQALRRCIGAEYLLICAVLIVSAVLSGALSPA